MDKVKAKVMVKAKAKVMVKVRVKVMAKVMVKMKSFLAKEKMIRYKVICTR